MRQLQNRWITGNGWPKRLEWLEIEGIRGWKGERVDFQFPIVAIVGENGSGKSTVLQAAAAVYRTPGPEKNLYASDFFPDTPFERITQATIRYSFREGNQSSLRSIRKPGPRWRGNPDRPTRRINWIDLSRIQPVNARVGYLKLLKSGVLEGVHNPFNEETLARLSNIVGKTYVSAGLSNTSADARRNIPVVQFGNARYSGFHQGAGEIAAAELLAQQFPRYSIVLVDEIETSLHPRAQRRLIRDLAKIARINELQIILTTHSPYVLDELPPEGRIYLMNGVAGKAPVTGVTPDFAMTRMDEENHPECDVYVEDSRAAMLVEEAILQANKDFLPRVLTIPFGAASVGVSLGQMVSANRFPRPSVVFLDGDQTVSPGCFLLPGEDAPERVVFSNLQEKNWPDIGQRLGRDPAETIDALNQAMTADNHHDWVKDTANKLFVGGDTLWRFLCQSWVRHCASENDLSVIVEPIQDKLN